MEETNKSIERQRNNGFQNEGNHIDPECFNDSIEEVF